MMSVWTCCFDGLSLLARDFAVFVGTILLMDANDGVVGSRQVGSRKIIFCGFVDSS